MDFFSALPEVCVSDILSLTSPRDVCRSSAISKGFKSIADSDSVWHKLLPSDYLEIVSRSVTPVPSTKKQLYFHLADSHILLDGGKLSFAIDKVTGKKCFMLGARKLAIIWGSSPECWERMSSPPSRFSEVAKLQAICWFDIKGNIEVRLLSPRTTYVAYLVFIFTGRKRGFPSHPAKASVRFVGERRDGDYDEDEITNFVYLKPQQSRPKAEHLQKRRDGWREIELGEFYNSLGDSGEVEMQLREVDDYHWESSIVVEGIEIRPKVES